MKSEIWTEVERAGFRLIPRAVEGSALRDLCVETERLAEENVEQSHGLRNLLGLSGLIRREAERFFGLALGPICARPLRAILFDKKPDANWRIGWHQDTNLKEDGRVLVPNDELHRVFTLRLHLDPTPATNAALRVLAGSHRAGRQTDFHRADCDLPEVTNEANPGDILVMRPLLFHASSPATQPARRRVIHVDYLQE